MHLPLGRKCSQMQVQGTSKVPRTKNPSGALLLSERKCQSITVKGAMHLLLGRKCSQMQVQGTSKAPRTKNPSGKD